MRTKLLFGMFILIFLVGCTTNSKLSVSDVTNAPQDYLNKNIIIYGNIISEGNYFTDSKFYLTDGTNKLAVNPWVPLEVMQCPINIECHPPAVMSDYLNKYLAVQGHLEQREGIYIFIVSSAEISQPD